METWLAFLFRKLRVRDKVSRRHFNWKKVLVDIDESARGGYPSFWSTRDYAELAGGLADSKVHVQSHPGVLVFVVEHPVFAEPFHFQALFQEKWEGPRSLHLRYIELGPGSQGSAIGTRLFAVHAYAAARLGFRTIYADALSSRVVPPRNTKSFNGAYTLARWGFDAELPVEQSNLVPGAFRHCCWISELMETNGGREYWRHFGTSVLSAFDLSTGSDSWKTLESYLNERAIRILQ